MYRRLNLLIYLNKGWEDEWGGHLELWGRDGKECEKKVAPIFNRAVLFSTAEDSYHGHPHPLTLPEGVTRKSLALYYYTVTRDENISEQGHTTQFLVPRKKTAREVIKSFVPPGFVEIVRSLKNR